jgi:hypothetical protein
MRSGIKLQSSRILPLIVLAAVAASCDKAPLLAPTSSTITITAPTRVLPLGGTTEVTAFVVEQAGTPVQNGTTVHFVTSLGVVSPVDAQTHNGMASTTFQAGDVSGVAEIRAISGNAGAGSTGNTGGTGGTGGTPTTTAGNAVQITIGAAAVETVTVRTNPATVSQNGGTVDVIATVLASGGRAVPGVIVTFSADHGTLSSTSAVSDVNGDARVQLTTNLDTNVSATAGSKTAATAAKVTAQPGPSVTLTCTSSTSSTCSTVNVGDVAAFTLARGATTSNIRSATLDFGDGTSIELGNLSSQATVSHQYTQAGTYTVRLTATDVNGEVATSTLVIVVQEVVSISLSLTQQGTRSISGQATVIGCTAQRYDWNFGNGATPASFSTGGNTASSTYASGGTKTVIVSARCTDGRTAQTSSQLDLPLP